MNDRQALRPMRHKIPVWAALGLLLVALTARAGTCSVSSSGLAFGAYQPLSFAGKLHSVDRTSSASISIVCTGIVTGGSYVLSLGPGNYGSGNRISPRYLPNLSQAGDPMQFNVYTDPAYSSIWSDGITAGPPFSGTIPAGDSQRNHTAYGRVPAGQSTLKAGQYADTLTMTLTFTP
jgi:spore coat protein U-like protein